MTEPREIYFRRIPVLESNPFPLGRNVKHDSRSRAYPFTAPEELPDVEVVWQVRILPLDQLSLGSCTGNAGTAAEATDDETRHATDFDLIAKVPLDEPYAIDVYSAATKLDPFQGDYPPEDTGSDGLSVAKVFKNRGLIQRYEHIFSLADAKAAIQRGPFITGVNWYEGMFDPTPEGIVSISGRLAGGHEFLVRGRKIINGQWYWVCRNSWGNGWGNNGDFYLSDSTYGRLLSEEGDGTVLYWVVPSTPGPTPEPPPFSFSSLVKSILDWLKRLITRT